MSPLPRNQPPADVQVVTVAPREDEPAWEPVDDFDGGDIDWHRHWGMPPDHHADGWRPHYPNGGGRDIPLSNWPVPNGRHPPGWTSPTRPAAPRPSHPAHPGLDKEPPMPDTIDEIRDRLAREETTEVDQAQGRHPAGRRRELDAYREPARDEAKDAGGVAVMVALNADALPAASQEFALRHAEALTRTQDAARLLGRIHVVLTHERELPDPDDVRRFYAKARELASAAGVLDDA